MIRALYFRFFLLLILLSGMSCSENENSIQEEFLSAQVDEISYEVNKENGVFIAQKQLTSHGTINLWVKSKMNTGETLEFMIYNYNGKKTYTVGNRQMAEPENFDIGNWCKYSEKNSSESWRTTNDFSNSNAYLNTVQITDDNGSYINGHFSFEGHNVLDNSSRLISEGNFILKLK